jgi:hypothetical protein
MDSVWSKRAESRIRYCRRRVAQASLAQICAGKGDCQQLNPDHPAFDEARGLIAFGYLMCCEPETAFTEYASKLLRADKIRYLNQKIPRHNFEPIADWAAAVAEEVKLVLLPATPGFAALEPNKLDPATEALRTAITKMQLFITTIHAREFLEDDLDLCARLDARIAQLTKGLVEIKTMKQMLRRTSTNGTTDE